MKNVCNIAIYFSLKLHYLHIDIISLKVNKPQATLKLLIGIGIHMYKYIIIINSQYFWCKMLSTNFDYFIVMIVQHVFYESKVIDI